MKMEMHAKIRVGAAALAALLTGGSAMAVNYADPTLVDLFRRVNTKTGAFGVQVSWTNINNGGGVNYPAYYAVDRGFYASQINYPSQATNNAAWFRLVLPEAVHVQTIKFDYQNSNYQAIQHRIQASQTGFSALTELVGWTTANSGAGPYTYTVNTNLQYLQFEFMGTSNSQYLLISEIQGFAGAGDLIDIRSGYNLFEQRATAGPIGSGPYDRGGFWADALANVIDLNKDSYIRANQGGTDSWFVVSLNNSYELVGAAFGFYHGQEWPNGIQVYVSNDPVNDATTAWTLAYSKTGLVPSSTVRFTEPMYARYMKIFSPGGTWSAMCEFEVYAIPTPRGTMITLR